MNNQQLLNMEVRSKILEYSLVMENAINGLLFYDLGLSGDKQQSRLFSNKGKISFQRKVDLLNDIGALSKKESEDLELIMIIRNKFMHDLNCDSFKTLFKQLDNGIVNRFKEHLDDGSSISNEGACLNACTNLAIKNINTIIEKIELRKSLNNKKVSLFQAQNEQLANYENFIQEFFEKVSITIIKNSKSAHLKDSIFMQELIQLLDEMGRKYCEANTVNYKEFFNSNVNLQKIFGINKDHKSGKEIKKQTENNSEKKVK